MTTVPTRSLEMIHWDNETRMIAALPEFADQHAHIDAAGRILRDGPRTRGALFVHVPELGESQKADIAAQDRAARQAAQWRAEIALNPCPTCRAEAGACCSDGKRAVDHHAARITASKVKPTEAKQVTEPATVTPKPGATSSLKAADTPKLERPASQSSRRKPLNKFDFISPERKRRIRRQAAHVRGDYLATEHRAAQAGIPREVQAGDRGSVQGQHQRESMA